MKKQEACKKSMLDCDRHYGILMEPVTSYIIVYGLWFTHKIIENKTMLIAVILILNFAVAVIDRNK